MLDLIADLAGVSIGSALDPFLWAVAAIIAVYAPPRLFAVAAALVSVAFALLTGRFSDPPYGLVLALAGRWLAAFTTIWVAHAVAMAWRRRRTARDAAAFE